MSLCERSDEHSVVLNGGESADSAEDARCAEDVVAASSLDGYAYQSHFRFRDPVSGRESADEGDKIVMMREGLEGVVSRLNGAGIQVVLVDPIPKFMHRDGAAPANGSQPSTAGAYACSLLGLSAMGDTCGAARSLGVDEGWTPASIGDVLHEGYDSANVTRVRIAEALCPDSRCEMIGEEVGGPIYHDVAHVGPASRRVLAFGAESSVRKFLMQSPQLICYRQWS